MTEGQRVRHSSRSTDADRITAPADGGLWVYPGEPGAFAEEAAQAVGGGREAIAVAGFRDVFEAVSIGRVSGPTASGSVAGGVLPIENVLGGTVRETYDLLLEHDLAIVGEVVVPVLLCLAALPGERLASIERVYSHVQALAQAERFLRTRPWTLLSTYNTAAAGRMVAERGERGSAAVLSPRGAALYGLEVLAAHIEDAPDDRTRFLAVARPGDEPLAAARRLGARGPRGAMRTTLVVGVANEPGSLARALAILAEGGLNMSKLESRPLRGKAWEYVFWIDLDADAAVPGPAAALDRLRRAVSFMRILGSYPRTDMA